MLSELDESLSARVDSLGQIGRQLSRLSAFRLRAHRFPSRTVIRIGTKAEVIREALRLYEFVIKQREQGATFTVRQTDGSEKDILLMS